MPKPRKNDLISCKNFSWRLGRRQGVWFADGRSNSVDAGRHSLGTRDRHEALQRLHDLDQTMAVELGLAPAPSVPARIQEDAPKLSLEDGRKLYETYIKRPRVAGGTRSSTQKRYRTVFDKFLSFAKARGIADWNGVTKQTVTEYTSYLEEKGYASKTLRNELVTLVQAHNWLSEEKHLVGAEPIKIKLKKVESERAYCYTPDQVAAMVAHCRMTPDLGWLANVIIALACTGLRIAELASLRWTDMDLANNRVSLTDESGRPKQTKRNRRELKSGRSRQLPIHPELAAILNTLPRVDEHVFHGPRGGRLKADTVRRLMVEEVLVPLAERFPSSTDEKGFKNGRLHSFRHYFASMCANRGVPERVAMEWLGHQDSDMVRHYYHLHDEESQRQMAGLDLLGTTGKRLAGNNNRAAKNQSEEEPSTKSSVAHTPQTSAD